MKVLAIGERPLTRLTALADLDVQMLADRVDLRDTHVIRCRRPAELPAKLERMGARQQVTRLDVFDHGTEGMQMLGEGALFASDAMPGSKLVGLELALQLDPYLADTAQVRLLGCGTGEGTTGRMLLLKVARALGGDRIVFGTIDRRAEVGFECGGAGAAIEHQRLFSSVAALDTEAPRARRRLENMQAIVAALR
jgi:hypothetical protein